MSTTTNTSPSIPLMSISAFEEIGKLVKKWAANPEGRPKTPLEFEKAVNDSVAGGLKLPHEYYKTLRFEQAQDGELLVRLPNAKLLKQHQDRVAESDYGVPKFYTDILGAPAFVPPESKEKYDNCRLGDYTMSNCG